MKKQHLYKTARITTRLNINDSTAQVGCYVGIQSYKENEDCYWVRTIDESSYYCAAEHLSNFVL